MDLITLEQYAFTATFIAFLIGAFLYIIYLGFKNDNVAKAANIVTIIGFIANTVLLAVRWKLTGHAPLTSGYEFQVSFTWGIALLFLIALWRYDLKILGGFVIPVAWLLMAYTALKTPPSEATVSGLVPALQSKWLTIHVATAIVSYGAFAVSFGTSIMYLIKNSMEKNKSRSDFNKRLPSLDMLDDLSYKFIAVGFAFLSLVIITGAIWAEETWGRYWGWDPKETWSLITWLVYAAYLHARFTYGWRGIKAAWMSIVGFAFVLFTLLGVNYLSVLHGYGRS